MLILLENDAPVPTRYLGASRVYRRGSPLTSHVGCIGGGLQELGVHSYSEPLLPFLLCSC